MSAELSSGISNWHYVVIEIFVGAFLAVFFFALQYRPSERVKEMTERIRELTEQKATAEKQKKAFECQRIIDRLQYIQNLEQDWKTYLSEYKLGDPTLKIFGTSFSANINSSVLKMKDAIGQLQSGLKDNALREQFSDYLGWFNLLPKRILIDTPQQEQQREGLLRDIDDQMKKIQEFIDRFSKERDSDADLFKEEKN